MPPPASRLPVTVLTGFLGAGKTTLLRQLLRQTEGERWALVVNDVAALNLDAALVGAATLGGAEVTIPVVPLQNGCVCCSLQEDLAATLLSLADDGRYSRIIVETTGVAEPRGIVRLFTQRSPFTRSVGDVLALESLVTVVDVAQWTHEQTAATTRAREAPTAGGRPLFELLVEQVECADLLVLNKCDLVSGAEVDAVAGELAALNPRAEQHRTENAQLAREVILGPARFDVAATPVAASWIGALNALTGGPAAASDAGRHTPVARAVRPAGTAPDAAGYTAYGLGVVTFQARRPFARAKFDALLETGLPGVLRAKGFYWLAEQPDEMGFVSIAGGVVRREWLSYWWAAQIEAGRVKLADRPAMIRALWHEPHGDRRQELVFIGRGLDETALHAALTACFT